MRTAEGIRFPSLVHRTGRCVIISKVHYWSIECLTWLFTRIWGHLLIPVLLGSIFWLLTVYWMGWVFAHWLAWVGGMLVLGWLLTIWNWVLFYWDLMYTPDEDDEIV